MRGDNGGRSCDIATDIVSCGAVVVVVVAVVDDDSKTSDVGSLVDASPAAALLTPLVFKYSTMLGALMGPVSLAV